MERTDTRPQAVALPRWRGIAFSSSTSAIAAAFVLVTVYVALRTMDAPYAVILLWTAAAAALTVASLLGGLTVLAAIGPFTEALNDQGQITAVPLLLAALGLGILLALARMLHQRELPRPPLPIVLAVILFVGTLVSVGVSAILHGPARGYEALQMWVPGIGGGLTVLFAAWLVGRTGEYRPLVVVGGSIALAALLSVADVLLGGLVRESPFGWLVRAGIVGERLGGVIPAPNAFAAILLLGFALGVAALVLHRRRRLWLAALLSVTPIALALAYTFSRSALLGFAVVAGVVAWRWRRAAGYLVLGGCLLLAVVSAPALLGARGDTQPDRAPGTVLGDVQRLEGWMASVTMAADAPFTGQGFRSFEWLHDRYGAPSVDAPHNEWLRLFGEGGIGVGLCGIAFAIASVVYLFRRRSALYVGTTAAAGSFFVMATFNNPFIYAQVTIPAFLVIGIGLGMYSVTDNGTRPEGTDSWSRSA